MDVYPIERKTEDEIEESLRNDLREALRQQVIIVHGEDKLVLTTKAKDELRKIQIAAKANIIKEQKILLFERQIWLKVFTNWE